VRRFTAAAVVVLALAGCSSSPEESAPTTTVPGTTTTLPPPSTPSTTVPDRAATEVNACRLLRTRELEDLVDEPGHGEALVPATPPTAAELPALLMASCAWPSADDPQLVLSYLAPTTAPDGPSHLEDVIDAGTGFGEGGQVLSEESGAEVVGILVDEHQDVIELATVRRAALVYLIVGLGVPVRDRAEVDALKTLVVTALSRAPR
jgi:hypothetical protein